MRQRSTPGEVHGDWTRLPTDPIFSLRKGKHQGGIIQVALDEAHGSDENVRHFRPLYRDEC